MVKVSYNRLWKLLIDKGMHKYELKNKAKISGYNIAKLTNDENVTIDTLARVCLALVLLINVAHIIAGMICRYFLEFGEVSNTYNFTLPNIAIHIVVILCICLCSYLHAKKQIAENKEER